jgi:uncharacterized protein YutE (UPF0331/DUF86 family)
MVDLADILTRLEKLRELIAQLQTFRTLTLEEYQSDWMRRLAAERALQLAIECVFDTGDLLIAISGARKPDRHSDVMEILRDEHIISRDLAERLAGSVGFRNILVHGYLHVRNSLVHYHLMHSTPALEEFARQVAEYLSHMGGVGPAKDSTIG